MVAILNFKGAGISGNFHPMPKMWNGDSEVTCTQRIIVRLWVLRGRDIEEDDEW